jgi:hypothetical protein
MVSIAPGKIQIGIEFLGRAAQIWGLDLDENCRGNPGVEIETLTEAPTPQRTSRRDLLPIDVTNNLQEHSAVDKRAPDVENVTRLRAKSYQC